MRLSFKGSKLAYILDDSLLVYKRDDYSHIPFPGLWDFPGGEREGDESPEQCVLRELKEEFSIVLPADRLVYKKNVVSLTGSGRAYFFVAYGVQEEIDSIQFGDEGQYWEMMAIDEYLSHPEGIEPLKTRLRDYLAVSKTQ